MFFYCRAKFAPLFSRSRFGFVFCTQKQDKGNINGAKDAGNDLSFSKILSGVTGGSVNDMLFAAFPANDVDVKVGNCNVSREIWERNEFPVWQYFHKNADAESLNQWRPAGAEPKNTDSYIQRELSKVGFGKIEVLMPERLQKRMKADPVYAQKIIEKVQKWKTDYDRVDNEIAASYGEDPVLYQMTKSYCIQLDEDGNVGDYTVISGGMDTGRSDETKQIENDEVQQKGFLKVVKQRINKKVLYELERSEIEEWLKGSAEELYQNGTYGERVGTALIDRRNTGRRIGDEL